MSEITELVQQPALGQLVELFTFDASGIGGQIYYFTPMTENGANVEWGGQEYTPIPIMFKGAERSSQGAQPRPTLEVSNVSKFLHTSVVTLGDLVGAKVTRTRTFSHFLDNGSSPDATMFLAPDIFVVEQKTAHNRTFIQWSLSTYLDQEGVKLPKRQILRDNADETLAFPGAGRVRIR